MAFHRTANAVKTNSAFFGSYTEDPFWYEQFDLRQIKKFRGDQLTLVFDDVDNCCLCVTTTKTKNCQDSVS